MTKNYSSTETKDKAPSDSLISTENKFIAPHSCQQNSDISPMSVNCFPDQVLRDGVGEFPSLQCC